MNELMYGEYKSMGPSHSRWYIWEANPQSKLSAREQYRQNKMIDPSFKVFRLALPNVGIAA